MIPGNVMGRTLLIVGGMVLLWQSPGQAQDIPKLVEVSIVVDRSRPDLVQKRKDLVKEREDLYARKKAYTGACVDQDVIQGSAADQSCSEQSQTLSGDMNAHIKRTNAFNKTPALQGDPGRCDRCERFRGNAQCWTCCGCQQTNSLKACNDRKGSDFITCSDEAAAARGNCNTSCQ